MKWNSIHVKSNFILEKEEEQFLFYLRILLYYFSFKDDFENETKQKPEYNSYIYIIYI